MPPALITTVLWVSLSAVLVAKMDINNVLMRFFRDLSRSKARRRLYGNKHALIPMLLGIEESISLSNQTVGGDEAFTLTKEELATYTGEDDTPIYIAIAGRIYDVSAGARFYGESGKYHLFVGKDATRAFGTGCLREECVSSSTEGLTKQQLKEVDRWIELYETHDKYTFVGYLIDDPVEALLLDDENDEQAETKTETEAEAEAEAEAAST